MISFESTIYKEKMFFVAEVPSSIIDTIGRKRHIPVRGKANDTAFKSACIPRKEGRYIIILNSEIRKKIDRSEGDTVQFAIEYDPESRDLPLPEDMEMILAEDEEVFQEYNNSSPSNRREYIKYIEMARHEKTRLKRINLLIVRLREKIAKRKSKS